jgi:glutamate/tyrosine decarboxylase-like PLP-dependent enzyme
VIEFDPETILERLDSLRAADAPTHGGHVLSYVYDSGIAALDELAAEAMRRVQPVNGLDPTTFTSVAVMEGETVRFVRDLLHGDDDVVGSVTTGGTESCMLAVKTARDGFRGPGVPRLVAPATVHAAFQKAAHYLGLVPDLVPTDADGTLPAPALIERMGPDVALVVVSAPSYPTAQIDPVADVAAAGAARGIPVHVDACIGGVVLPFWPDVAPFDFRVPGVTSVSVDLHKFGYAPKGVSVLLQRGRDRQRLQYFATTRWPGYPVINPTMLGSKSAAPLAAAWAILQALGTEGLAQLTASCERSTSALVAAVSSIRGLRVVGTPTGPLFAVAADEAVAREERVDPHHLADAARALGWFLQQQPASGAVPRTAHLTVTPVTEHVLDELIAALHSAADAVRGVPPVDAERALAALPAGVADAVIDSESRWQLLRSLGIGSGASALPERMAPLLALIEALPPEFVEPLLAELIARVVEPGAARSTGG